MKRGDPVGKEKSEEVYEIIKSMVSDTDRRFQSIHLYEKCGLISLFENFPDLQDELYVLEKKGVIYNIGGSLWCIVKKQNIDPSNFIKKIKEDIKKGKEKKEVKKEVKEVKKRSEESRKKMAEAAKARWKKVRSK